MVVEQVVERSLPTSEIRGSNRAFGKFYLLSTALQTVLQIRNIKKQRGRERPLTELPFVSLSVFLFIHLSQ